MKLKHKISLLVIGILLVVSILISYSYALWVFNVSQESTNVLVSDCFEITLTDNNPIGLGASFPMRDSDGVKTNPYTFTIRNICNHPADFQINLETLNTSTIDESFIKADLNGHITEYNAAESAEPTIEGAKSAVKLYEDTLAVNGEKTYNLRIWVNKNAIQEDVENKTYASKVSVKATVRRQFAEGTLLRGEDFNAKLKKLADGGTTTNTSIKSIEWSENAPLVDDNAVNIAATGTNTPIYAWYKDGTIYINSELDKIYMNPDSSYMFSGFYGLTSLNLSNFDTSNVTDMHGMFGVPNVSILDLSSFDTSNVTNMKDMFGSSYWQSEYHIKVIKGLENFNTSKVTNMSGMFGQNFDLESLDLSSFDTSNVTDMSYMFINNKKLINLNVISFNTSNVTDMTSMFEGVAKLPVLDLSSFDTSQVTTMLEMFKDMNNIKILDLKNFHTSNVTDMSNMFAYSGVESVNLNSFDTSKVTSMESMFRDTYNLKKLDLSSFDTSKVTDMGGMFFLSGIYELNIKNFNTSNVTDMSYMFSYTDFETLNLSSFDTSKVTNMSGMFYNMNELRILDISSFDTSKVTNMASMYYGLSELETIYIGNVWNTAKLTNMKDMFGQNYKLVGGSGTTYDYSHSDAEYARVDDPDNGKPGYFTLKTN